VIGRILSAGGHDVRFPQCNRLFERCVSKDSVYLRADASAAACEQVCDICTQSSTELFGSTDLATFPLSDVITVAIRSAAAKTVDALSNEALLEFTFDDFRFGELCRHDLILSRKLMLDTPLEPEHYQYLRQYLKTVLATYIAMRAYLDRNRFTDVLLYGQYAANTAVICAARKNRVNWRLICYINHLGVDHRRIYIMPEQSHLWTTHMIEQWQTYRDMSLGDGEAEEIGDDVLVRFGSSSFNIYSPPKTCDADVFAALGLDRARRLIVAFTSSLDEYNAEQMIDNVMGFSHCSSTVERPYADQIAWLTQLACEIGNRCDLQLVIRIHPREDANKRDGMRSQHLEQLRQRLAYVPSNVKVVWPADPVSSYDLLESADLVQVWSSTIGLEAARLGLPVIKLFRGYASYPEGDFAFSAPTHASVIALMEDALTWPTDFDRLRKAWRFYGYSRFASSLDLRDVLPKQVTSLPELRLPRRNYELTRAILDQLPLWTINRQANDFLYSRLTPDGEAEAIRCQLRRLLYAIFTGAHPLADVPVSIRSDPSKLHRGLTDGSFASDGAHCSYVWAGKVYSRYSPMCARLANFLGQQIKPVAGQRELIS
jgi:hypothetical protein